VNSFDKCLLIKGITGPASGPEDHTSLISPLRLHHLRYFRKCWGDIYRRVPHVIVEVQNNNFRTSPLMQRRLIETSVRDAVESVMRWDD
jgi:hypothetical protein